MSSCVSLKGLVIFVPIVVVFLGHILHMEMVDLVDDFQVPGQKIFQHCYWPSFQGFGQDSVVGVGTHTLSDIKSLKSEK